MYVRESSSGMVKAVLILVAIVMVVTFFGALGLADSGLLNWHVSKAEAQQILVNTQIDANRAQMELPYMEERLALENERLRLMQQEANRMMVAENNRTINFKEKANAATIVIGSFAAIAFILVLLYGLMLLVGRLVEQAVPAKAQVAQAQAAPSQPPQPQAAQPQPAPKPTAPFDPWKDDNYRRMMKARARQQERTILTREAQRQYGIGRYAQPTVAPTTIAPTTTASTTVAPTTSAPISQNGHSHNDGPQNGNGFIHGSN